MRFALGTKLFALTTLVVAVIMVTVTYLYTVRQRVDRITTAEGEVARIGRNIATLQLVDSQDWSIYQQYISRLMDYNRDIVYIAVLDERRTIRAHTVNLELIDVGSAKTTLRRDQLELVTRLDAGQVARESKDAIRVQRVNIQSGDRVLGSVHVGFSLLDINRELQAGLKRNVMLALVFLALTVPLVFVLSRRLTGPLYRLSVAMAAISRGDLEQQVVVEGRDEIGELATTFNQMVEGLRERRAIDRLGRELGSVFEIERLASLVRAAIGSALGGEARMFLGGHAGDGDLREVGGTTRASFRMLLPEVGEVARAETRWPQGLPENAALGPSDVIVPLPAKEKSIGFLAVSGVPADGLDHKRRHFVTTLAGQAGLALANALLYRDLSEQARLKSELDIARAVQRKLLPLAPPRIEGWSFDAACEPALEVGGDYYDFVHLGDDRLGVIIADVSGKGASASLYMAEMKGLVLSLATTLRTPRELLLALNRHLYPSFDRHVFASVLYGILDLNDGSFRFVRAGHGPLLVVTAAGAVVEHTPVGIAVGLDPGPLMEKNLVEQTIALAVGDTMVLWTDGLVDVMNPAGERFGESRLMATLEGHSKLEPTELTRALLATANEFAAGQPRPDDLTLVVARRGTPAAPPS